MMKETKHIPCQTMYFDINNGDFDVKCTVSAEKNRHGYIGLYFHLTENNVIIGVNFTELESIMKTLKEELSDGEQ